jgi:predicted RNase H-like nuclease
MLVVGLDGCVNGWAAVCLEDGAFADAAVLPIAADALSHWPDLAVLAIDIPIGLPGRDVPYPRQADMEARKRLLNRRSSVFLTPRREVLMEETYPAALARSLELAKAGLSRQSYALRSKILEVDELARSEPRVREVHPEVSFLEMAGHSITAWYKKRTWNGLAQRRACLERAGITVPDHMDGGGLAGADDVLDAAAAGWSAWRIATGRARTLPDPPQAGEDIQQVATWY